MNTQTPSLNKKFQFLKSESLRQVESPIHSSSKMENLKHRPYPRELKHLTNEELHQNLLRLVGKERELLSEILLHIREIDARKLYLKMAYPNLFEYMTKHLGYSAGSAQRRIDAARLSKEVPSVIADLEKGDLNLAQIGLLQKSLRQSRSSKEEMLGNQEGLSASAASKETKEQILNDLKHKSFEESQGPCPFAHVSEECSEQQYSRRSPEWQPCGACRLCQKLLGQRGRHGR